MKKILTFLILLIAVPCFAQWGTGWANFSGTSTNPLIQAYYTSLYANTIQPLTNSTGQVGTAENPYNSIHSDTINSYSIIIPRKVSSGFMPFHALQTLASNWDKTNLNGIVTGTTAQIHYWMDDVLTNIKTKGLFTTITLDSIHFYGLADQAVGDSLIFLMRTYYPSTFKVSAFTTKVIDTVIVPNTKGWVKFTVNKNVASFGGDSSAVYCVTPILPAGTPSADTLMLIGYRSYYSVAP